MERTTSPVSHGIPLQHSGTSQLNERTLNTNLPQQIKNHTTDLTTNHLTLSNVDDDDKLSKNNFKIQAGESRQINQFTQPIRPNRQDAMKGDIDPGLVVHVLENEKK